MTPWRRYADFFMRGAQVPLLPWAKRTSTDPKYAGLNRRMLAATIDSVLIFIALYPLTDMLLPIYFPPPPIDWAALRSLIPEGANEAEANRIALHYFLTSAHAMYKYQMIALQIFLMMLATAACWRAWSSTPGKWLLRMKIVDADTEAPISDAQIVKRLFGYIVSTLPLFLGFFWESFDRRRQGWHDKLAGTVVVIKAR